MDDYWVFYVGGQRDRWLISEKSINQLERGARFIPVHDPDDERRPYVLNTDHVLTVSAVMEGDKL